MLDSSTKGPCPLGWIEHNGNCYFFNETVANFTTAEVCFIAIGCYISINILLLIFYTYMKKCLM